MTLHLNARVNAMRARDGRLEIVEWSQQAARRRAVALAPPTVELVPA